MPFGDGPRICIGASFALQEAVIILATLMARFKFTPIEGKDPEPVMILTLRPEGGVWLNVEGAFVDAGLSLDGAGRSERSYRFVLGIAGLKQFAIFCVELPHADLPV